MRQRATSWFHRSGECAACRHGFRSQNIWPMASAAGWRYVWAICCNVASSLQQVTKQHWWLSRANPMIVSDYQMIGLSYTVHDPTFQTAFGCPNVFALLSEWIGCSCWECRLTPTQLNAHYLGKFLLFAVTLCREASEKNIENIAVMVLS